MEMIFDDSQRLGVEYQAWNDTLSIVLFDGTSPEAGLWVNLGTGDVSLNAFSPEDRERLFVALRRRAAVATAE